MKVSEYANALQLINTESYVFRYTDESIPRSRISYDYKPYALVNKSRSYIRLLAAALQLDATVPSEIVDKNFARYLRISRINSTSASPSTYVGTPNILYYTCMSHAAYEAAKTQASSVHTLFDITVTEMSAFDYPGVTYYHGVRDACKNVLIVVVDNNMLNQDVIDFTTNAFLTIIYQAFKDELTELYSDDADKFDPAILDNTFGSNNDDVLFACDEYDVPEFLATGLQQILEQRRIAEEEERKAREEAEAAARAERLKNLSQETLQLLSDVQVLNNNARMMREIKASIEQYQNSIRDCETRLHDDMLKLQAKQNEYNAYLFDTVDISLVSQVQNLIGLDKCIKMIVHGNERSLKLLAVSPIIYWEQDELPQWKTVNDGRNWNILKVITSGRFQYMTAAVITIDFAYQSVSGTSLNPEDYNGALKLCTGLDDVAKHPHVARYSCFGNNEREITKALREHKFDLAFTYINSCMMQLNLTDGCVVNTMCDYIESHALSPFFLDTTTGEMVSFNTALAIINTEENN